MSVGMRSADSAFRMREMDSSSVKEKGGSVKKRESEKNPKKMTTFSGVITVFKILPCVVCTEKRRNLDSGGGKKKGTSGFNTKRKCSKTSKHRDDSIEGKRKKEIPMK